MELLKQENQSTTYKIRHLVGEFEFDKDKRQYREVDLSNGFIENIISRVLKSIVITSFKHSRFMNYNFDHYKDCGNTSMEIISNEVRNWDGKEPVCISLISKQNGIGKTGLAVCLFKKFAEEDIHKRIKQISEYSFRETQTEEEVLNDLQSIKPWGFEFVSARNIDMQIRMSYSEKYGENEKEILDKYCRAPFLIIDDIFSSSDNDFSRRNILYILDERLEFQEKTTVITSNYDYEALKKIDSRIASRMNLKNGFYEIVTEQKDLRSL